jgi:hypothetical protein
MGRQKTMEKMMEVRKTSNKRAVEVKSGKTRSETREGDEKRLIRQEQREDKERGARLIKGEK